jgi:Holliday junction resolvase RusA-like endonuclease
VSAVEVVSFLVPGKPVQQGSKQGYVVGKRAVLVDANKTELKPWRAKVTAAARAAHEGSKLLGAVVVAVEFRFVRPKTVKRAWPAVKPDLDKLERAILDGVTDAGVWADDSQVVRMSSSKVYAEVPGAWVRIGRMKEEQWRQ